MTHSHSFDAGECAGVAAQQPWHAERVLLVEGDRDLRRFLCRALREDGYEVREAEPADRVLESMPAGRYGCVVLGEMSSGHEGSAALRGLRTRGVTTPVLLLTVRADPESRVRSLDAGADDALGKPFDLGELLARVRALVRRAAGRSHDAVLRTGDLTLDRLTRRVTRSGRPVDLTGREFALLEFLMRNAGRTVSRSCIAAAVWNRRFDTGTNVIDVYVSYLRHKLRADRPTVTITSVRGVGYRLEAVAARDV